MQTFLAQYPLAAEDVLLPRGLDGGQGASPLGTNNVLVPTA